MPATISSTFNSGAEGWTLNGDVASSGWSSSGGDPGGYLYWVDAATGATSYYDAPTKFLGSKQAYYGGVLSYDILDTGNGSPSYDVQLTGAGHTLQYTNPDQNDFPTPNQWTPASVQLVASNFIDTATGAAPSVAEMQSVLADLTDMQILAEYVNGPESGGLDNVGLIAPGSSYIVSSTVTSTGVVLSAGDTETVLSGGVASATHIHKEGYEYVSAGGVDSGAIVSNGGVLIVSSGGIAGGEIVANGGTIELETGAVGGGGTVSSGGLLSGGGAEVGSLKALSGAQVDDVSFTSGSVDVMSAGAVETGVTVSSGAQLKLVDPTIGGAVSVGLITTPTSVNGVTVQSGAKTIALDATVVSGGVLSALKGSVTPGVTVSGGGVVDLSSGSVISQSAVVSSGGQISGPGVVSGFMDIEAGATVSNVRFAYSTTVDDYGALVYGGAAKSTLEGFVTGNGAIDQDGPGALIISSFNNSFDGELVISGGSAELANSTGLGGGEAAFESTSGATTLKVDAVDQPSSGTTFATPLVDFDSSTKHLDLAGLTFTSGAAVGITSSGGGSATLTLQDGGYEAKFTLTGAIASNYVAVSDGAGGTEIRAATPGEKISFQDNFNSGASPEWSNSSGNWSTSNGTYLASQPSNDPYAYTLLPYDITNYTLTIEDVSEGDSGIFLRSDGTTNNGILLVLGGNNYGQGGRGGGAGTSIYFQIIQNGVFSAPTAEVDNVLTPGDNYNIKVVASGDTYKVYVNKTLEDTLTSSLFSDGEVGLYDDQPNTTSGGSGAPSAFDNFTLTGSTASSSSSSVHTAMATPLTHAMASFDVQGGAPTGSSVPADLVHFHTDLRLTASAVSHPG